jgi:hypothetical protein
MPALNPLCFGGMLRRPIALTAILMAIHGGAARAEDENEGEARWNAHFETTYIRQYKPAFPAAYSGPHSLMTQTEASYSFTATAFFGLRLWHGAEFYFDPEAAQGKPLSGLVGLGGFTNGELARVTGESLTVYRARLFLRQTFGLGGGTERIADDANQLAGTVDRRRIVVTAGNFSVLDIFDDNAYSHDPRTQFMNWSLYANGAFDYAADARGYTWGLTIEYFDDGWGLRAGRFIQPKEPNGLELDPRILKFYGDVIEGERSFRLAGQPGKVRLLAYRNRATMGAYADAIAAAEGTNAPPTLDDVRRNQTKSGMGINFEQALADDFGVFGRAGFNDGKTETYAFTEIDQTISLGGYARGARWSRPEDTVGIAFARNGISAQHQQYLALGGLGFFLGDGRLNYGNELVFETYYNIQLVRLFQVTLDYQHIENPGYNRDRGPVNVYSVRLRFAI